MPPIGKLAVIDGGYDLVMRHGSSKRISVAFSSQESRGGGVSMPPFRKASFY